MHRAFLSELLRLAGLGLLGAAAGLALDVPALGLALGVLAFAGWHLRQWWLLRSWLRGESAHAPPLAPAWREFAQRVEGLRAQVDDARQARARLQQQLDALAGALPDAAVVVGRNQSLEWFNRAAEELLDLRSEDLGSPFVHLVREPKLVRYLREGDMSLPLQLERFAHLPHPVSVGVTAFGAHSRLVTFRDMTQGLRHDRMLHEFVANVSHELRTPLTVLSGYLETLEETERGEAGGIVARMAKQCRRMRQIVEDLLELSRLEASRALADEDMEEVALTGLAQEVQREMQNLAAGATHRVKVRGDASVRARGRREELYRALSNLVSNALRYSPDGGKVTIRCEHGPESWVQLSVQDEGIGIAQEHIARLAERFYRVDKARSRETGGTGLGLAIVKEILERHGGRLRVQSAPGAGSTFTCVLPAARSAGR